jgi:glyoxylate reductase
MKVYITRKIPEIGIKILKDKGFEVSVNPKDRPLTKQELINEIKGNDYAAVLTLLTDIVDAEVMDSAPSVRIYANFAIGYNNFDVPEAKKRGIYMTNTPGGGADRVAEHTWALILALTCRVVEGDKYMRSGKYNGWDPMLLHGTKIDGKTLGILGSGRIGADVAHKGKNGFGMQVIYYDVKRNEQIEKELGAKYYDNVDDVLRNADIISIHVPLLDSTHHLIDERRLNLMKSSSYLINTSRGPVIDEKALVDALKSNKIKGAGLDVFEFEPKLADNMADLSNVVMTPHIASGTEEARIDMATISANNIIDCLSGIIPRNNVV